MPTEHPDIEGMARAIAGSDAIWDAMGDFGKSLYLDDARAAWAYAIERLREPSEGMLEAGEAKLCDETGCHADEYLVWRAMLDAKARDLGLGGEG